MYSFLAKIKQPNGDAVSGAALYSSLRGLPGCQGVEGILGIGEEATKSISEDFASTAKT
jgi:hypothetical protein